MKTEMETKTKMKMEKNTNTKNENKMKMEIRIKMKIETLKLLKPVICMKYMKYRVSLPPQATSGKGGG